MSHIYIYTIIYMSLLTCTHTIFEGVTHEQLRSSIVGLFDDAGIASYFILGVFPIKLKLFIPIFGTIVTYCNLLSFHRESSECHISQNIRLLLKT